MACREGAGNTEDSAGRLCGAWCENHSPTFISWLSIDSSCLDSWCHDPNTPFPPPVTDHFFPIATLGTLLDLPWNFYFWSREKGSLFICRELMFSELGKLSCHSWLCSVSPSTAPRSLWWLSKGGGVSYFELKYFKHVVNIMALSSTYEEMFYNLLMRISPGCGRVPDARATSGEKCHLSAPHFVGNGWVQSLVRLLVC